tara:strand:+ start:166 stop:1026 length:861 start_codon:yes stop_codon:yes gene_type:complete
MAFGGGSSGSAALTAHTHNQALAGDGGQLSQTLTDMNGVVLYSEITDNSAAVAANTVNITANTAAIAAIEAGLCSVTFQDDFTSDNFTDGGGGDVSVVPPNLVYAAGSGTSDSRSYYDLGATVSETKWTLRWKQTSTTVAASGSSCHVGMGISSTNTTWDDPQNGLCFVRGSGTSAADNQYYLSRCTAGNYVDNGASNKAGFTASAGDVTGQVYYVQLMRTSASNIVASIYSDEYITLVESESFTNLSGVTSLRYLKCGSLSQNVNTNNGTIDDVKFYNGCNGTIL